MMAETVCRIAPASHAVSRDRVTRPPKATTMLPLAQPERQISHITNPIAAMPKRPPTTPVNRKLEIQCRVLMVDFLFWRGTARAQVSRRTIPKMAAPSIGDRLHDHVLEAVLQLQVVGGRTLHQQDQDNLLLRIDAKIGIESAAPSKSAGRAQHARIAVILLDRHAQPKVLAAQK